MKISSLQNKECNNSLENINENNEEYINSDATETYKSKYVSICKKSKIPVISSFMQDLSSDNMNLAHRGIGDNAIKGISISLRKNIKVVSLNLTDNKLGVNGAISVGNIFKDNCYIERLNLSCNLIGNDGLTALLNCIERGSGLVYLSVSDNKITGKAAATIGRFMINNKSINELDLSKNNLCDSSGGDLREGLQRNKTIETLDLSWNKLRANGSIEIAKSLENNTSLNRLNLAWNGFEDEAAIIIGESLSINNKLEELDLSNNRVSCRGAAGIACGVRINKCLKTLFLKGNPIKPDGIQCVLENCLFNKTTNIRTINLETAWVSEENKALIDKLETLKPGFIVIVGGYIRTLDKLDLNKMRHELIILLKKYLSENRLRAVDLFNMWDKDRNYVVTRNEFRKGVKTCMPTITNYQINILTSWFDPEVTDAVHYSDFLGLLD